VADPLATIEELDARVPQDVLNDDKAMADLEDASALVRDEGDPEWTVQDVPDRVRQIVLAVARRSLSNPDGYSQTSVGDVSVSYSRTGMEGAIYLTRAEHRAVKRAAGRLAGSVTLVSPWNGE
jgi:hypothetical protein